MSCVSVESHWRCPNCNTDNTYYNNGWMGLEFKEYPGEEYQEKKCKWCGKEYYVSNSEPNPFVFRMNKGACKNDYIKNLVISKDEKLTMKLR